MNFFSRRSLALLLILLIAASLRLYRLTSVPPSPSLDEVSIGYNAYSILETGADEYGARLPMVIRAYDDWRPALYVYFVIPWVSVLGLNVLAVRLPAVMLSLVTIFVTYCLAKEMFRSWEKRETVALAAAFLLSISPWHIYMSRLGHEVNLGLTLVALGTYFFFRWYHRRSTRHLILSALFFSLSLYSYQSQKVVVPILVFGLLVLYGKELWSRRKDFFLATTLGSLIAIFALSFSLSPTGLTRFKATTAFSGDHPIYRHNLERFTLAKQQGNFIGQVIYNRRFVPAYIFLSQYASHFDPRWLFAGGPMERHKVPNMGLFYPWEAALFVLGIVFFFKSKLDNRIKVFMMLWFLTGPIPGAITTQAPHAMRTFTFLPMWQIFSALGFWYFRRIASFHGRMRSFSGVALASVVVLTLGYFFRQYFQVFPKTQSDSFQYALAQAIPYVLARQNEYRTIVFSNQDNLYQSYMFFLFFAKYDPWLYREQGGTGSGGFAQRHRFGKYEFRPIPWLKDRQPSETLMLVNASELSDEVGSTAVFRNLDGRPAVVAVSL